MSNVVGLGVVPISSTVYSRLKDSISLPELVMNNFENFIMVVQPEGFDCEFLNELPLVEYETVTASTLREYGVEGNFLNDAEEDDTFVEIPVIFINDGSFVKVAPVKPLKELSWKDLEYLFGGGSGVALELKELEGFFSTPGQWVIAQKLEKRGKGVANNDYFRI